MLRYIKYSTFRPFIINNKNITYILHIKQGKYVHISEAQQIRRTNDIDKKRVTAHEIFEKHTIIDNYYWLFFKLIHKSKYEEPRVCLSS